ncbi:MAG TPA: GTP-binding protein, partial [Trueperaceae bacterium]|nr:GTP-binding protein [Trueperaceae bacterium]
NAAMGLNKNLSKKLDLIQTDITKVYASIQAVFDYPDEGVPDTEFGEPLLSAIETIDSLLKTAKAGKISQQGAKLAIIGKPNVGKSSLLNTLLGYDRSIVSNIPGTTRDYLEVMLDINGVPVLAIDTAGLRETKDIIEEQGVVAAKDIAQNADLVLYLFDASQGLDGQRIDSKELNLKRTIVIANKVDLIDTNTKFENHIQKISVTNNQGIDKLKNLIKEKLIGDLSSTELWLTTERHEQALRQVKSHLQQALSVSEDLASIDLELALKALAEITGRSEISEETLEYIFANFCVGK